MTTEEIKKALKTLREAEEALLDLPLDWQEKAAGKDIDTLNNQQFVI